jgi:hypothetical protein
LRANAAAGVASSANGTLPNLSAAVASPAGVPGTPHEAAPM